MATSPEQLRRASSDLSCRRSASPYLSDASATFPIHHRRLLPSAIEGRRRRVSGDSPTVVFQDAFLPACQGGGAPRRADFISTLPVFQRPPEKLYPSTSSVCNNSSGGATNDLRRQVSIPNSTLFSLPLFLFSPSPDLAPPPSTASPPSRRRLTRVRSAGRPTPVSRSTVNRSTVDGRRSTGCRSMVDRATLHGHVRRHLRRHVSLAR